LLPPIVNKIVAATEKEPGTLAYEYTVGDDQKTVDIYERYTNAHAAVVHVTENIVGEIAKLRRAGTLRYAWHTLRLRDAGPSEFLHISPFGTFRTSGDSVGDWGKPSV
jgi:hypothetical protein